MIANDPSIRNFVSTPSRGSNELWWAPQGERTSPVRAERVEAFLSNQNLG